MGEPGQPARFGPPERGAGPAPRPQHPPRHRAAPGALHREGVRLVTWWLSLGRRSLSWAQVVAIGSTTARQGSALTGRHPGKASLQDRLRLACLCSPPCSSPSRLSTSISESKMSLGMSARKSKFWLAVNTLPLGTSLASLGSGLCLRRFRSLRSLQGPGLSGILPAAPSPCIRRTAGTNESPNASYSWP